ncbi:MAG: hypothetical protein NVSMB53_18420 [Gemmatimonadaceae bacterium]
MGIGDTTGIHGGRRRVSLLAVKALAKHMRTLHKQTGAQRKYTAALRVELALLADRLAALEAAVER